MGFDVKAKENKPYVKYFKGKKALVVGSSAMNRSTIRKFLTQISFEGNNIFLADNLSDAENVMTESMPEVVIVEDLIGGKDGLELLAKHKNIVANRLNTMTCVISEENSPVVACRMAEEEVDVLVSRPFTLDSLEKEFIKHSKPKVFPSKYRIGLEKIRALINHKEYQKAIDNIERIAVMSKRPVMAYYFEALAYKEMGDLDNALKCFEKAADTDPTHYKTLATLYKLYVQNNKLDCAYDTVIKLMKSFPLIPEWIPDIIKILLANQKYEDILNYCEVFTKMEERNPQFEMHVAAGLALSGNYFIKLEKPELAVQAFKRAVEFSGRKLTILAKCIQGLIDVGEIAEANNILNQIAGDDATDEIKVLELRIRNQIDEPNNVLKYGMMIMKQGVIDPLLYEILIDVSKKLERKIEAIEDLVFEANKHFPDQKDFFNKFLST